MPNTPGYITTTEEFPLPRDRPSILKKIGDTLSAGLVQRLVVDVHKGVKVWRLTKVDNDMQKLADDDVMSAIRNAPMEEISSDLQPFELIFKLFSSFTVKKIQPKSFIVKSSNSVKTWLKVPALTECVDIFCVPIIEHLEVPDDVIILVGSSTEDIEEVIFSFKISMTQEKKGKSK